MQDIHSILNEYEKWLKKEKGTRIQLTDSVYVTIQKVATKLVYSNFDREKSCPFVSFQVKDAKIYFGDESFHIDFPGFEKAASHFTTQPVHAYVVARITEWFSSSQRDPSQLMILQSVRWHFAGYNTPTMIGAQSRLLKEMRACRHFLEAFLEHAVESSMREQYREIYGQKINDTMYEYINRIPSYKVVRRLKSQMIRFIRKMDQMFESMFVKDDGFVLYSSSHDNYIIMAKGKKEYEEVDKTHKIFLEYQLLEKLKM